MSDQCKHCTVRGDLKECESQPCTTHESWYVKQLTERAEKVESAWQDAELRAEKAEARVKELEDTVTGLEAALNSLGQS